MDMPESLDPNVVFFFEGRDLRELVDAVPEGHEDIRDAFLEVFGQSLMPVQGPMALMDRVAAYRHLTTLVYSRLAEVPA